jgi:hypothetical protein
MLMLMWALVCWPALHLGKNICCTLFTHHNVGAGVVSQVGARYRIALQLHPHEDFAANPPHGPLGPTAARWRALQARGWRVSGTGCVLWFRQEGREGVRSMRAAADVKAWPGGLSRGGE